MMGHLRAMDEETPAAEAMARDACDRRDYHAATAAALGRYGYEIYSFLLAQFHGHQGHADEVFSEFSEDFWRGLPGFAWRCSIRAWCYKLARSAASRYRRAPYNRADRRARLSTVAGLDEIVQSARTTTHPFLRTDVKDEFQRLRDRLGREDQDLLILRVDRDLSWRDVAHAMAEREEPVDEAELLRLEAALRQRFSEIKRRLKRFATEAGLL